MVQMVTAKQLSDLWGVSRTYIYELEKKGVIPERDGGQWQLIESTQKYIAHLRQLAENTGSATLANERTRKAKEEADKLEDERKVRQGILLNAADVDKMLEADYVLIRGALIPLPSNMSAVACKKCRANVLERGQEILYGCLSELSNARDIKESKKALKAATKAKPKRVGGQRKIPKR